MTGAQESTKASRPTREVSSLPRWRGRLRRCSLWGLAALVLLVLAAALFYAEENRRGKREWEKTRTRLASRGVELDWHRLAPPLVADADNFASTPFFAALFDFLPGTYTPRDLQAYNRVAGFAQSEEPYAEQRGRDEFPAMVHQQRTDLAHALQLAFKAKHRYGGSAARQEEPKPTERREQAVALLEALESYRSVLDELRSASRRPEARFNLSYAVDYPWALNQPHVPVLKRINRVLSWRASANLALENSRAALEDIGLMLALAEVLRSEPFQNSFRARCFMLLYARQIIWEGLADHRWTEAQLRQIETWLQPISLLDAPRLLQFERASGNCVFEMVHKTPGIVKGWRFGSGFTEAFRGFALRHMPEGWMYLEQASYQRQFDEPAALDGAFNAGCVQPHVLDQLCAPALNFWSHRLIAAPIANGTRSIFLTAALAQTGLNQALLACALGRFRLANGQFPEQLDNLPAPDLALLRPDLIGGKPMKYRRNSEGQFVLYSVGWNEKDDGGKTVIDQQSKEPDATRGDWVWPAYPVQ